MAEGLLNKWARDQRWDVEAKSAGLAAFGGVPATPEAIEAAVEKGVDLTAHQSQPLSKALVLESDLIVTMTTKHKESILRKMPDLESKVKVLSELAGEGPVDIEDPVGLPLDEYRKVLGQIEGYLTKSKSVFN